MYSRLLDNIHYFVLLNEYHCNNVAHKRENCEFHTSNYIVHHIWYPKTVWEVVHVGLNCKLFFFFSVLCVSAFVCPFDMLYAIEFRMYYLLAKCFMG